MKYSMSLNLNEITNGSIEHQPQEEPFELFAHLVPTILNGATKQPQHQQQQHQQQQHRVSTAPPRLRIRPEAREYYEREQAGAGVAAALVNHSLVLNSGRKIQFSRSMQQL